MAGIKGVIQPACLRRSQLPSKLEKRFGGCRLEVKILPPVKMKEQSCEVMNNRSSPSTHWPDVGEKEDLLIF